MKQGLCDGRSHLGWVVFSSWTWTIPEHPWHSQEWDSEATISAVPVCWWLFGHSSEWFPPKWHCLGIVLSVFSFPCFGSK